MFYYCIYLSFTLNKEHLFFLSLKQVQCDDINRQWGNDCPKVCTCKNTSFIDLPMVKWMYNEIESHNSNAENMVPSKMQLYTKTKIIISTYY